MGKTEKIVVLSVLFIVVMLFTWSLLSDGTGAQERDGSAATAEPAGQAKGNARELDDRGPRKLERNDATGASKVDGPVLSARDGTDVSTASGESQRLELEPKSGLLNAEIGRKPADEPKPIRMQPGWDLVTTAGLESTVDPGTMVMTPREDATWDSLARDLYGDESKASLLRHSNEGMAKPGKQVLVPVKDDIGAAVDERIVEVLDGESLWGVAVRTLGNGARWREIFEANRDVLTDPDFVAPGVRLKIPVDR